MLVEIARADDSFRQAMRGEQHTGWLLVASSQIEHWADQPGDCFDKSRV